MSKYKILNTNKFTYDHEGISEIESLSQVKSTTKYTKKELSSAFVLSAIYLF